MSPVLNLGNTKQNTSYWRESVFSSKGVSVAAASLSLPFWRGLLAGSCALEVRQTDSQFCCFLKFSAVSSTYSESFHRESRSHEPLHLLLDQWKTRWQIWRLKNLNKETFKNTWLSFAMQFSPLFWSFHCLCSLWWSFESSVSHKVGFVWSVRYPFVLVLLSSLPTIFPWSQTQPCLNFILLLSILTWNPKVRFIILWNP